VIVLHARPRGPAGGAAVASVRSRRLWAFIPYFTTTETADRASIIELIGRLGWRIAGLTFTIQWATGNMNLVTWRSPGNGRGRTRSSPPTSPVSGDDRSPGRR
jgi:hypothetical protein